jgi:CBS domain-containing protein
MQIKNILREKGTEVVTIEMGRTIQEAICKLNNHGIGALIVTGSSGDVSGIITERDILRECGERCARLKEKPNVGEECACLSLVEHVMTRDVIIGLPEDSLDYVMKVMTKNHIRHLPIIDGGKLTGIISIGDVVNSLLNESEFENRMLKDYIQGVQR